MARTRIRPSSVPSGMQSWSLRDWPQHIYPNSSQRARYLLASHRDELLLAGALVRVGRELVVLGDRYARWLQKQGANVTEYSIAPNERRERAEGGQGGTS